MKIQIMSDLHNEFGHRPIVRTDADIIVLAGDIATKTGAIPWIQDVYRDTPVVYIAGNHEYYHSDIITIDEKLRTLTKNTNINFLQNKAKIIKGIRFLGTTMWTNFTFDGEEWKSYYINYANRSMNDFSLIKYDGERFTALRSVELHNEAREFLKSSLSKMFDGKTVVVTHHAPYPGALHPNFKNSPLNSAFIVDMTELMLDYKPDVWIYGHTHDSFRDEYIGDTRIISNPRGYPGTSKNSPFIADFTINL